MNDDTRDLDQAETQFLTPELPDEALEAAARKLVGRERALLKRNQRIEIAALGFADADVWERRAGELGRHGPAFVGARHASPLRRKTPYLVA